MGYAQTFSQSERQTPQSEPLPGRDMVRNYAGGYTFKLNEWGYLERFLILGSEKPTYYASSHKMTLEAGKNVIECLRQNGRQTVDITVSVSEAGRAVKNDPALFVMALAMSPRFADRETRSYAASMLPRVARTGSHLLTFVSEVDKLRGWGRLLVDAVSGWYQDKDLNGLAYQTTKYQSRAKWSHRDIFRKTHLTSTDPATRALYDYIVHGLVDMTESPDLLPDIILGKERLALATNENVAAQLIIDHRLTHEMVPNEFKNSPVIWNALLQDMPITAMIRNLGVMTDRGLLRPMSNASQFVVSKLTNETILSKARVHPISLLNAWNTYRDGHGLRGGLTWTPDRSVTDALETAFYSSFEYVEPTNKRILIALDVSGSMGYYSISGLNMSAREGAAVMGLVTAKREPQYESVAFQTRAVPFKLSVHDSFEAVIDRMAAMPYGGTDCSQPMIWAQQNKLVFDAIINITDQETWAGGSHPSRQLEQYRHFAGIPTKMISVGMTSTGFTIADPEDAYSLDIVGFDTQAPSLMSTFISAG